MSEPAYDVQPLEDYSGSLYDRLEDEDAAYEAEDAYVDPDEAGDYVDEPEQVGPPDERQAFLDAQDMGADPYLAGVAARRAADEWWSNFNAEREYREHVEHQHALHDAREQADELIEAAGRRHDAQASAADGTLFATADAIIAHDRQVAFDSGDVERWQYLGTPEGARAAIEYAAQACREASIIRSVVDDKIPAGLEEHAAKMRAEFDAHESRR